ncbi:exodeoxyribonuclease III [Oenococcus oeni]|uniref:exodeoxyribonuclease III n=1 Tax=Oenococcus oeni TaxID=1247 RepID=UPI0007A75EA6|nr:exodeoxyribonuclease III [Oenococcus oeni]KZD14785.1 Exodeoxyribonuclease III [Oenococcus oeni]
MNFISWNIDSLNAAIQHKSPRGELTYKTLEKIAAAKPDFFSIQETKLPENGLNKKQDEVLEELFPNYLRFVKNSTPPAKKGYAGVMTLAKEAPISYDKPVIDAPGTMDQEGRIVTLEYPDFYLLNVYTPNSGDGLRRLPARGKWDDQFRHYISDLSERKIVIFSGDLNVAHEEIDLKNSSSNHNSAGFTDQEREKFSRLLSAGFTDTWRLQHPKEIAYSWWSQRNLLAKTNNAGWRIDYYIVSNSAKEKIVKTGMIDTGTRADHAPIYLQMKL